MKDIAIMGGTFDPIHNGHLVAGQSVYDTGLFSEVMFMPSGQPPHKENALASGEHRLEMCRLATQATEGFTVSDFELTRTGNIYTVDTFKQLRERDPKVRYWLIIGTDSFYNLQDWYQAEFLLKTVNFIVVDRGGYDNSQVINDVATMNENHQSHFKYVVMPLMALSSTHIRARVKNGQSNVGRVPSAVAAYIADNQLYL